MKYVIEIIKHSLDQKSTNMFRYWKKHCTISVSRAIRVQCILSFFSLVFGALVLILEPRTGISYFRTLSAHSNATAVFLNLIVFYGDILALINIAVGCLIVALIEKSERLILIYINIMISVIFLILLPSFGSS